MRVLLVVLALCLVAPGVADAAYVPVKGAPAEGPSKYDRVWVEKFGPASAKKVLVLVPGFLGGVGRLRAHRA